LETRIVLLFGSFVVRDTVGKLVSCKKVICKNVGEYVESVPVDVMLVTEAGNVNVFRL
jgi:hypothetical protein